MEAPVVAEGAVEPELAELGAVDTADLQAELAAGRVLDAHPPRQAAAGIGREQHEMGRCAGSRGRPLPAAAFSGTSGLTALPLNTPVAASATAPPPRTRAAATERTCRRLENQRRRRCRRARVPALRGRGQLAGEGLVWVSHAFSFTSRLSVARPRETRLRTTCSEHPMPAAIAA